MSRLQEMMFKAGIGPRPPTAHDRITSPPSTTSYSSSHMEPDMAFRALASQQTRQLEEKDRTIDRLEAFKTASDDEAERLHKELATAKQEIASLRAQQALAPQRTFSIGHDEEGSKVRLQLQLAREEISKLQTRLDQARPAYQDVQDHHSQGEQKLKKQIAKLPARLAVSTQATVTQSQPAPTSSDTNLLRKAQAEAKAANARCAHLSKQLAAANAELAQAQGFSNDGKPRHRDEDQDDQEYDPAGRELFTRSLRSMPPHTSPFSMPQGPGPSLDASYGSNLSAWDKAVAGKRVSLSLRPASGSLSSTESAPRKSTIRDSETPQKKRKRNAPDWIDDDLEEGAGDNLGGATSKQKRSERTKRKLHTKIDQEEIDGLELSDYEAPTTSKRMHSLGSMSDGDFHFAFEMVTEWNDNGTRGGFEHRDLKGTCAELWEKIEEVKDIWEEAKGLDWQYEFTKPGKKSAHPCVTRKLLGRPSRWRSGCEGKYACKDCVEQEKPCFTWDGDVFMLLPLHEDDRLRGVVEGFEIRWWMNL